MVCLMVRMTDRPSTSPSTSSASDAEEARKKRLERILAAQKAREAKQAERDRQRLAEEEKARAKRDAHVMKTVGPKIGLTNVPPPKDPAADHQKENAQQAIKTEGRKYVRTPMGWKVQQQNSGIEQDSEAASTEPNQSSVPEKIEPEQSTPAPSSASSEAKELPNNRLERILAAQRAREAKLAEKERQRVAEEEKTHAQREEDAMNVLRPPRLNPDLRNSFMRLQQNGRARSPPKKEKQQTAVGRQWKRTALGWMQEHNSGRVQEYFEGAGPCSMQSCVYAELKFAKGLSDPLNPLFFTAAILLNAVVRQYMNSRCELTRDIITDVTMAVEQVVDGSSCVQIADNTLEACERLVRSCISALESIKSAREMQCCDVKYECHCLSVLSPYLDKIIEARQKFCVKEDSDSMSLIDLPVCELMCILVRLDVLSVLSLACTCKSLASICSDEEFWEMYCGYNKIEKLRYGSYRTSALRSRLGRQRRILQGGLYYDPVLNEFLWIENLAYPGMRGNNYIRVDERNIVDIINKHKPLNASYVVLTRY